jgi:hypothetical protein
MSIDVVDGSHDAVLEFLFGGHANVAQNEAGKLGEETLDQVEPGAVLGLSVMSFGGFLGMGHDHYPIPWPRLTYNEKLGGYEVNISEQELKGAPKYGDAEWNWDQDQGRKVYDYYKVPPYWG